MFTSEPYVIYTVLGFQAVADVLTAKGKKEHYVFLGARSLGCRLFELMEENNGLLSGIDVWIYKRDESRYSGYVVEQ